MVADYYADNQPSQTIHDGKFRRNHREVRWVGTDKILKLRNLQDRKNNKKKISQQMRSAVFFYNQNNLPPKTLIYQHSYMKLLSNTKNSKQSFTTAFCAEFQIQFQPTKLPLATPFSVKLLLQNQVNAQKQNQPRQSKFSLAPSIDVNESLNRLWLSLTNQLPKTAAPQWVEKIICRLPAISLKFWNQEDFWNQKKCQQVKAAIIGSDKYNRFFFNC